MLDGTSALNAQYLKAKPTLLGTGTNTQIVKGAGYSMNLQTVRASNLIQNVLGERHKARV